MTPDVTLFPVTNEDCVGTSRSLGIVESDDQLPSLPFLNEMTSLSWYKVGLSYKWSYRAPISGR